MTGAEEAERALKGAADASGWGCAPGLEVRRVDFKDCMACFVR